MRAGGRCQRATSAVLLSLIVLGCEHGAGGQSPPLRASAGANPATAARFELARVVAELAASSRGDAEPMVRPGAAAYAQLRAGASDGELRELLRHASPVVRVSAIWTLAER